MNSFDVIIIGGGPAGLFAALQLKRNKKVLLLEKNSHPGKKLLLSGSGRCNLTHSGRLDEFLNHYGQNFRFLRTALRAFSNEDLIGYFNSHGLPTTIDKNGKVFPAIGNAGSVLDILIWECKKHDVCLHTNETVSSIDFELSKKSEFCVTTSKGEYTCKYLVIATGGLSYPGTGSNGDGFVFSKQLGHTIVNPKPALTPVYIKDYAFSAISGLSLTNRTVYLYRGNKKINQHQGDIGFTHRGLSGPGILDFSRYLHPRDVLRLGIVSYTVDEFSKMFLDMVEKQGKTTIKQFLKTLDIPSNLLKLILLQIGIEDNLQMASITRQKRLELIDSFCNYPFIIERLGDFKIAMVTSGGVSLKEVSSKTMASKLIPGLYFAGEVLDIDGDTGGYNIQAAFSTGVLAARSISKEL